MHGPVQGGSHKTGSQHLPRTGRTKAQFLRAQQLGEGQTWGKLLQEFSGPWDGESSTTSKNGQANPLSVQVSVQVLTESQNTRGKADWAQERTPPLSWSPSIGLRTLFRLEAELWPCRAGDIIGGRCCSLSRLRELGEMHSSYLHKGFVEKKHGIQQHQRLVDIQRDRVNIDIKACSQDCLYLLSGCLPSFHPCKILGQARWRQKT